LSGLETALFALKSHQIQRLENQHPSLADFLRSFRENPRRVLNVLLLGDTVVNVPLVILCLVLIWEDPLSTHLPVWLAALAIFAVVVLVCDLIPKLLALSTAYRISALGVFTLKLTMPLLDRVGQFLENASNAIIDRLTPARLRVRPRMTDEELETLVEMGEAEGTLAEAEGEMIQEIIKLGDKTAKDCMTPRVDTFAIPDDLPNDKAIALFKKHRHHRVPVYAETPDQIVGLVDVKQFLLDSSRHYTETLIAPSFVPETMPALELLRRFLTVPQGLAIVVDEFGGTEGIITLDDIIEQIISDAAPLGDAELYIEPIDECRLLVSGNARLDDLTEHLGFELTADGIDTIGGYIFNRLGYLPKPGQKLDLPHVAITVRRVSRKRIEEAVLEKTGAGATSDSDEDEAGT
jgi:CBS domain containing-hemolysin-like protein